MSRGLGFWVIGAFAVAAFGVSACKQSKPDIPAVWTVSAGTGANAARVELSTVAVAESPPADNAAAYQPTTLHIVCRGGRPNVEFEPLKARCYGWCGQQPTIELGEAFLNSADLHAQLASVSAKPIPTSPPFEQDLLSNAPGDIVITGDTKPGAYQTGKWTKPSTVTSVALRFDYGSDMANPGYVAQIDRQARNYINRIASSRWFTVGSDAQFDPRGLSAKLPQFWAACPAPKGAH